MSHYVGLDYSKRSTSVCVVNSQGTIVKEGTTESSATAIRSFLRGEHRRYAGVGLEASSPMWIYDGLRKSRLPIIRIETFHAHSVLRATRNKTDRNDARGIAEIMRIGAFKEAYSRSIEGRRLRVLLASRELVARKLRELEASMDGLIRDYALPTQKSSTTRLQRLGRLQPELREIMVHLLEARSALRRSVESLGEQVRLEANRDPVCRLLMTAPGIGPVASLTFRAAVDDPHRFSRSRNVGAHFGMTPRTYQSGATERRGRISRRGDPSVRSSLYLAARCILRRNSRPSQLKSWGVRIAQRRGWRKAYIAVARRLAVILHRMWLEEAPFIRQWSYQTTPAEVEAHGLEVSGSELGSTGDPTEVETSVEPLLNTERGQV